MKKIAKKNSKLLLVGIVLGILISGGIVYAVTLGSDKVSYDNTKSGMKATTMQGALDELYDKVDIRKYGKFVSAFSYNESSCVTGEEDTCKITTCYQNKTAGSCKAGDIIKYKVNKSEIVTFHVMYDHGSTMTMQTQNNIVNNYEWINTFDYQIGGGNAANIEYTDAPNDMGPLTALKIASEIANRWSVNNQTYTMGTDGFNGLNANTGCSSYNSCTSNKYTMSKRTTSARLITVQEAVNLGCTDVENSCPKWMGSDRFGFWTMNASSSLKFKVWVVESNRSLETYDGYDGIYGIRPVVEVNK